MDINSITFSDDALFSKVIYEEKQIFEKKEEFSSNGITRSIYQKEIDSVNAKEKTFDFDIVRIDTDDKTALLAIDGSVITFKPYSDSDTYNCNVSIEFFNYLMDSQQVKSCNLKLVVISLVGVVPEQDGLLHYFRYDTSGDINDVIGSLTGTNTDATFDSNGKNKGAYSFNGTTSNIAYNGLLSTDTRTIRMWVKTSSTLYGFVFSDTNFFWDCEGDKIWCLGGSGGLYFDIANYNLNQYNHIVITYNSSYQGVTCYINGVAMTSGYSHTGAISGSLKIGSRNDGYLPFTGELDEIAMWNVALTESEILKDYNSGNGAFY